MFLPADLQLAQPEDAVSEREIVDLLQDFSTSSFSGLVIAKPPIIEP
jgi:hypothetical protein